MSKKLLVLIGILLLLGAGVWGGVVFLDRHKNKELVKSPATPENTESTVSKNPEPSFDKKKYSLTDPTSPWIVVNKKYPISSPPDYEPTDLTAVSSSQKMRKEAASALTQLIAAAKSQKLTIQPLSGYRSYSRQVTVYNQEVAKYGQAVADSESAKPGYSEHQTGWAIDVGGGGCGIEDCFGNTAEGKWLAIHAYEYGFIVRYTADKQVVTGYRAEPWHIRYLGTELSNELHRQNITTLEEFFGL